ncbi:E3 ubiquitin-protein ligase SIRP1-like isoform X1 [Brassica napus]|uniref:E3 ubiquitin-protein ligase SIRP1-like isoform X1 n=1 Tax=Brassica napus TaxID=3708 RepID=UPI002078D5A2|nr:E3 ubiquitin-protein ligase SIRP1-like isoform X1 [Brassica napus]
METCSREESINQTMEEEEAAVAYWCHMCSRTVDPLMEAETKCPFCASGFVEEMAEEQEQEHSPITNSLLAPILMQVINESSLRTSNQSVDEDAQTESGNDVDSQLQEILRRRRARRSVSVMPLLDGDGDGDRERGSLIVVSGASLSEYFIGPGFEALLQRLTDNDPNRYGTPPAQKEAVEALASVKILEPTLQCSVCLDEFEIGVEAKEMPCEHKFHGECLLPWLELHSSCPVCRYELPSDETKTETARTQPNGDGGGSESSSFSSIQEGSENSDGSHHPEEEEEEDSDDDGDDGVEFSIPWLLSSLFSSSQDSSNPSSGTH